MGELLGGHRGEEGSGADNEVPGDFTALLQGRCAARGARPPAATRVFHEYMFSQRGAGCSNRKCLFYVGIRREPYLHHTRRSGAGEGLAPRLLAARYYYRTRPDEHTGRHTSSASRRVEASVAQQEADSITVWRNSGSFSTNRAGVPKI